MVKRKKRRAARRPTNPTPVVAGTVTPMRLVPSSIGRPEYADRGYPTAPPPTDLRKTDDVIDRMRRAGSAARRVLKAVAAEIAPGVTTEHLDEVTHETSIAEGGYPSPLNYNGFPKSLCTSINEVICHGIPDDRPLVDGDIVNCDVTLFLDGVHGDLSETFLVGEVEDTSRRLVEVTRQSMYAGIGAVRAGGKINEIGQAIQTVAEGAGFGVVREFIGHGVGEIFHHQPNVPHYYDPAARFEIEPGMTFTIEPMITVGAWRAQLWNDGWTATTIDLSRCAQFEHTLLVLEDGVELLTVEDHEPQPFMARAEGSGWPEQLPTALMLADRTR
jgi:methionyl aminopeptidase